MLDNGLLASTLANLQDLSKCQTICTRKHKARGSSYLLRSPDGIIKVTDHHSEYAFALKILQATETHICLPVVYKAVALTDKYFAIWREDLQDINSCCAPDKVWRELQRSRARAEEHSLQNNKQNHPHIAQINDLYLWLKAKRIRLIDMGKANWGLRDSTLVVRDLGGYCPDQT